MSKAGTISELYDCLAAEISKGRGSYRVHVYLHEEHKSAPWLSEFVTLAGSEGEPAGEWRLYLSSAPAEGER